MPATDLRVWLWGLDDRLDSGPMQSKDPVAGKPASRPVDSEAWCDPCLRVPLEEHVGKKLRDAFNGALSEPAPDRLLELLRQLEGHPAGEPKARCK